MNTSPQSHHYGCSDLAMFEPHKTAQMRARILESALQQSDPRARVCHDPIPGAFYNYRCLTEGREFIVRISSREIAEIGLSDEKFVANLIRKIRMMAREIQRAATE